VAQDVIKRSVLCIFYKINDNESTNSPGGKYGSDVRFSDGSVEDTQRTHTKDMSATELILPTIKARKHLPDVTNMTQNDKNSTPFKSNIDVSKPMDQSSLKATFKYGHGSTKFGVKLVQFGAKFLPPLDKSRTLSKEIPILAKKRVPKMSIVRQLVMGIGTLVRCITYYPAKHKCCSKYQRRMGT
jgi:hypothetical protein